MRRKMQKGLSLLLSSYNGVWCCCHARCGCGGDWRTGGRRPALQRRCRRRMPAAKPPLLRKTTPTEQATPAPTEETTPTDEAPEAPETSPAATEEPVETQAAGRNRSAGSHRDPDSFRRAGGHRNPDALCFAGSHPPTPGSFRGTRGQRHPGAFGGTAQAQRSWLILSAVHWVTWEISLLILPALKLVRFIPMR